MNTFGCNGGTPHTTTGSATASATAVLRPHLSLVPEAPAPFEEPLPEATDQWQDRALCAQTIQRSSRRRAAPRVRPRSFHGCVRCGHGVSEYALWLSDERFGIWGGLSECAAAAAFKRAGSFDPPPEFYGAELVVDRRVDDGWVDVQVDGHLGHQDFVRSNSPSSSATWARRLGWFAKQDDSRASHFRGRPRWPDEPGQRDRSVGDDFRRYCTPRDLAAIPGSRRPR